jgi:hypothetical protein
MLSLIPFQLQGPILATVAAILYFVTYRFNELFDAWFLYAQGINLVFLPAGIKHLAILLGGPWGALGCFVSLFILANEFWQGVPTGDIALYSLVSTCATWAGIAVCLKVLGLDRDLTNIRFIHLPLIDLFTTFLHGFTTNVFFILKGMKTDHLMTNALAMMVGDFIGSFIILTLLWLVIVYRNKQALDQS